MSESWRLILSVLSILGAYSGASGLRFCFREYGYIEKEWEKGKKDSFVSLRRRIKLLLIPVGVISLFVLFFIDREFYKFVGIMMLATFSGGLFYGRNPRFSGDEVSSMRKKNGAVRLPPPSQRRRGVVG